jgi:hypothetical protein
MSFLNLTREAWQQEDQSWLGSEHGTSMAQSITLQTSAFTAGTHYPNGYFKSGIPLGKITASGLYVPHTAGASNGSQNFAGFLFTSLKAPTDTTVNVQGALLDHGRVLVGRLPVALDASVLTNQRFIFV